MRWSNLIQSMYPRVEWVTHWFVTRDAAASLATVTSELEKLRETSQEQAGPTCFFSGEVLMSWVQALSNNLKQFPMAGWDAVSVSCSHGMPSRRAAESSGAQLLFAELSSRLKARLFEAWQTINSWEEVQATQIKLAYSHNMYLHQVQWGL